MTHAVADDALIGRQVGNFVIEHKLGAGGMGSVYRASHREIGMKAAIKLLEPRLSADPELERRFISEARVLATLDHPGVVKVFDFGRLEGRLYYVMEALEGRTLGDELAQRGALSPALACELVVQISDALEAAHQLGVVHRDLKPANVFVLSWQPLRLKLLDFGVAKLLETEQSVEQTKSGVIVGTPLYASPEQAAGKSSLVSSRTDIYALGAMLFTMLAGRPPFLGDTAAALLYQHMMSEPPPLRELLPALPAPIAELVHRCLAKEPAARPESAVQLATQLEGAVAAGGSAVTVAVAGPPKETPAAEQIGLLETLPSRPGIDAVTPRVVSERRRSPSLVIALIVVAAVAGAVIAGAQLSKHSKGEQRATRGSVAAPGPTQDASRATVASAADAGGRTDDGGRSVAPPRPAAGGAREVAANRDAGARKGGGASKSASSRRPRPRRARKGARRDAGAPIKAHVAKAAPVDRPSSSSPDARVAAAPVAPTAAQPPADRKGLLAELRRMMPRLKIAPSEARAELKRNMALGTAALVTLRERWRRSRFRGYELLPLKKLRCVVREMKTRKALAPSMRSLYLQSASAGAKTLGPASDWTYHERVALLGVVRKWAVSYAGALRSRPAPCR
jgi:tRNA A-37 threonylcarbamoyl transferase component Bud32